jgi:hypothetical protein
MAEAPLESGLIGHEPMVREPASRKNAAALSTELHHSGRMGDGRVASQRGRVLLGGGLLRAVVSVNSPAPLGHDALARSDASVALVSSGRLPQIAIKSLARNAQPSLAITKVTPKCRLLNATTNSSIGAALSLVRAPAPISSPSAPKAPKAPRGDWGHLYRRAGAQPCGRQNANRISCSVFGDSRIRNGGISGAGEELKGVPNRMAGPQGHF